MHDGFIQAIQEAKTLEELAFAQGIYADWLEEQGDPRCELLRLAVKIRKEYPPNRNVYDGQPVGLVGYRRHQQINWWWNEDVSGVSVGMVRWTEDAEWLWIEPAVFGVRRKKTMVG